MKVASERLDWGSASRAMEGERESGDRCVVKVLPDAALIAAIDGLGHGTEAAAAARVVAATIEEYADEPVITLLRRCHEASRETRGVVMSLAALRMSDSTLTWAGVGNVEGVLLRADPNAGPAVEYLLQRSGVVGFSLPELRATVMPVRRGDTLVFATDGIRSNFISSFVPGQPPQKIAERILARHAKGTDDALVVVARFLGGGT